MPRAFSDDERARIRALLVDGARRHASVGGLRRLPIERLCREAGISKGAFYLFFPSKQALVLAVFLATEAELRARLQAAASEGPVSGRLRAVLEALFEGVENNPALRLLTEPDELGWLIHALPAGHFEAARRDDDRFAAALLTQLVEVGAARPDIDPVTFAALPSAVLALVSQSALVGPDRSAALRDLLIESLLLRLGCGGA